MTVESFDPKQTTTLDTPKKVLAEQADTNAETAGKATGSRIGFVSLGCLR